MSAWKRGFLEITAEILENLMANPLKKTHVTFKCNLDSRAVSKYLALMIHVGLVEQSKKDPSYYAITPKGVQYTNQFRSFVSIIEEGLGNVNMKNTDPKQLIADLKMSRH